MPERLPTQDTGDSPLQDGSPRDEILVRRAVAGDREAFGALYRRHVNRVYGLSLRLAGDQVEAETLTQDAFVRAWSSLGSFSGTGQLAGWLSRLTVNLWRDRYRSEARKDRLLQEAALEARSDAETRSGVIPLLTAMDLEKAIGKLPKGARTIFVLHDVEGYKHHEIASLLELTTGTVKSQLHRARRLLRVMLEGTKSDSQGA